MSSSNRLPRQNSGKTFSALNKPFNDRKRSANIENYIIAAGVANLKIDTNEDEDSMLSSRLVTGNLDDSMNEPSTHFNMTDNVAINQQQVAPSFNKYSSHHNTMPQ